MLFSLFLLTIAFLPGAFLLSEASPAEPGVEGELCRVEWRLSPLPAQSPAAVGDPEGIPAQLDTQPAIPQAGQQQAVPLLGVPAALMSPQMWHCGESSESLL